MTDNDIKRGSLGSLREMYGRGEIRHNKNAPDGPELNEDFWTNAVLKEPEPKKAISLRVDREVLDWFRAQGEGYQTRMNAVLRSYMEGMRHRHR